MVKTTNINTDKRKVLLEKYDSGDYDRYKDVIRAAIEYKYGEESKVLVTATEGDYQGSSILICKDNAGRYYYYAYSWGSCSGCDELQAREDDETVHEMVSRYIPTQHENKQACINYMIKDMPNSYDKFLLGNAIDMLQKSD